MAALAVPGMHERQFETMVPGVTQRSHYRYALVHRPFPFLSRVYQYLCKTNVSTLDRAIFVNPLTKEPRMISYPAPDRWIINGLYT